MTTPDYQVIARRFRPQTFEEVIGQEAVTQTLANAISKKRIAQAYLFAGPRGVGKTSIARILAKSLNCSQGPTVRPCGRCDNCRGIAAGADTDVLEIDGASNRSIDDIRELRERVRFAPGHSRYKIYIIDEVHMLTTEAFNALLKTLEEPPPNVLFVFATTRLDKVPATIVSRCQRFNFKRIGPREIEAKLRRIAQEEGYVVEDRAFALIARKGSGSMRDAESLFDQVIAFSGDRVTVHDVERTLGLVAGEAVERLVRAVLAGDGAESLRATEELVREGADLSQATQQAVELLRDLTVIAAAPGQPELLEVSEEERERLRTLASSHSASSLLNILNVFLEAASPAWTRTFSPRIVLEYAVLKASRLKNVLPLEKVLEACREAASASPPPPGPPPPPPAAQPSPAAPKGAAPAAPPATEPPPSLTELREKLLQTLARKDRALYALMAAARVISWEEGVLRLGFPATQRLSGVKVSEPDRRAQLAKIVGDLLGRPVQLQVELEEEERGAVTAGPTLFGESPLVDEVVRNFGGDVVDERELTSPEGE